MVKILKKSVTSTTAFCLEKPIVDFTLQKSNQIIVCNVIQLQDTNN